MESKTQYKRMWENKGHRPYWAQLHVQALHRPFELITGWRYEDPLFIVNNQAINAAYLNIQEMENATTYFEQWWSSMEKIEQYFKSLENHFAKAAAIVKKYKTAIWTTLSTEEITRVLREIADLHGFSYLFVTQPQHVFPLEKRLQKLVEGKENADKIISYVTTPKLPLPFDEEQQEIEKYRKTWDELAQEEKEKVLGLLVEKYGWFTSIEGEVSYDHTHYEHEIMAIPLERSEILPMEVEPEIKELGYFIGLLSNKRIWARWYGMSLRYCMKLGIKELIRRFGLTDLEYATLDEIEGYIKTGELDLNEVQKRRERGYVATIIDAKPVLLTGEKAERLKKKVQEDIAEAELVKGRCANPGKIKAKVRIISFADEQYHKEVTAFQPGEILVTGMTRPQIAHLCYKASAIITDEGGITSHASIISREFNIPCIIATHNATKIFKTGEVVEVDADKGIARKVPEK